MPAEERKQISITDNHGRPIEYVRLSVTDRCNLRCFYCMPATGVKYVPRAETLSYEEMLALLEILAGMGVRKLRITGGEPFVKKDLIGFLAKASRIQGIEKLSITTNGVLTEPYVQQLKDIGIDSVNLSLDTLDRHRFHQITRRDELPKVMHCLEALLEAGLDTKINMVVMEGQNEQDILPMARLAKDVPITVRYIEEMPFNGGERGSRSLKWTMPRILASLQEGIEGLQPIPMQNGSTAQLYEAPGFVGQLGIIAAFSRSFCGSCNRIRISAKGVLKTCLYGKDGLDLKEMLRAGQSQAQIADALRQAFGQRHKDGFEAEKEAGLMQGIVTSMSAIGG